MSKTHVEVHGDDILIPVVPTVYGLIPELGGTTAFAVFTVYLAHIEVYKEQPTLGELAESLGITRQTVSKTITNMLEHGIDLRELGVKYLEKYA